MPTYEELKQSSLVQSIVIDGIGMASYALPLFGEGFDIFLAPFLAMWIWRLHGSWRATAIEFFEEILPFTDIVPTATVTWWYRYIVREQETRRLHDKAQFNKGQSSHE